MSRVMVVEDEQLIAKDIADTLSRLGYDVTGTVSTAEECVQSAAERRPDLVLMDIHLEGDVDGVEAARLLRERFDVPVVFLSAYADEDTVARAKLTAPLGYLIKPFRKSELQCAIEIGLFRHQLERQLRHRERWFSTTLRSIGEAVIAVNPSGQISFMNAAAEQLVGRGEADVQGRPIWDVFRLLDEKTREPVPDPIQRALSQREVVRIPPYTALVAHDRELPIDDSVAPIVDERGAELGAVVVLRDITEERRLQRQVAAADRLASLGALAAGIAHEINNPLTYILGNVTFMGQELSRVRRLSASQLAADRRDELTPVLDDLDELVREVEDGAYRVSRIVADLGQFGRRETDVTDGDAIKALEWALRVSHAELKRVARVRRDFAPIPRVRGDEGRLGQVFLNLLLNAAHAMTGGDPDLNELQVSTRVERTSSLPGEVTITIRDTGTGMAPEVLERIFDPFFTTKPVGTGTGLGLSVCHGVIRDLGGSIEVTSELQRGSTFVVRLPEAERGADIGPTSQVRPAGARGRVLLVDDEPLVLAVLSRMLSPVHEVVTANSGRQALAELAFGPSFDVIVCDLLMPEMSGMDLYYAVQQRAPELASSMIFLSGGANTVQVTEFVLGISNQTLAKPPSQVELLMAIQRELDGLLGEGLPPAGKLPVTDPKRRPN